MPKPKKSFSNLKQFTSVARVSEVQENKEVDMISGSESNFESDDEYQLNEELVDESLLSEIVLFILNENSSKRSLSVLVFAILKLLFIFFILFEFSFT
jgi:hypothetical protein